MMEKGRFLSKVNKNEFFPAALSVGCMRMRLWRSPTVKLGKEGQYASFWKLKRSTSPSRRSPE